MPKVKVKNEELKPVKTKKPVYINSDFHSRLKAIAACQGRNLEVIVNEIVGEYLVTQTESQ